MAQTTSRYCLTCRRMTLHQKDTISALAVLGHVLLVIFTCSLWLFVIGILLLAETLQPYKCSFCGSINPRKPPPQIQNRQPAQFNNQRNKQNQNNF